MGAPGQVWGTLGDRGGRVNRDCPRADTLEINRVFGNGQLSVTGGFGVYAGG